MTTKIKSASQTQKRIDDLEDAIFSIHAHSVNIGHHMSRIDIILRGLFTEKEFLTRSQDGGRNPVYVADLIKMIAAAEKGKK